MPRALTHAHHTLLVAAEYRGSFGTSIVRVFDTVAGSTGWSEAECVSKALPYAVHTVTGFSHASYYPSATNVTLKVLYDPSSGALLGAQAVGGPEGVDKRLDVLATALHGRMTIEGEPRGGARVCGGGGREPHNHVHGNEVAPHPVPWPHALPRRQAPH